MAEQLKNAEQTKSVSKRGRRELSEEVKKEIAELTKPKGLQYYYFYLVKNRQLILLNI